MKILSDPISFVIFVIILIIIWVVCTKAASKAFESNDLKDYALNISGIFILKISLDNKILSVNNAFLMYTYYDKNELLNKMNFGDIVDKESDLDYKDFLAKLYSKGSAETEIFILTHDKKRIYIQLSAKAYKEDSGIMYYIFVGKDISYSYSYADQPLNSDNYKYITVNRELASLDSFLSKNLNLLSPAQKQLREIDDRRRLLVDSINIGMIEYDFIESKLYITDKCHEIFSIPQDISPELAKLMLLDSIHKDDYFRFLKIVLNAINSKTESFKCNIRVLKNNDMNRWIEFFGKISYDENGSLSHLAGSVNDITSSYIYQERIKTLAYYDSLTGLHNRTSMKEQVNIILKTEKEIRAALIFLDMDDFKFINDSFGHSFGDNVICEMAKRVSKISEDYLVGRFSGDELAIFITDYGNVDNLISYIEILSKTLSISYNDDEITYSVSASIGVSLAPQHGEDFESLMKSADIAMNEAKAAGKNRYLIFNEIMHNIFQERIELEKDLRRAIVTNTELSLFLQPQFDIATGELHGFEALVRWNNKIRGYVSPSIFIPMAEETRLIVPLGRWILSESCITLKKLQDNGYGHLKISVNLSAVQLLDDSLIDNVKEILFQTRVNTKKLELEITETALMESFETNIKKIYELKEMGMPISLDDFGTGYSSLTYMKMLPMSTIKIDKSFIDNISNSDVDRQITQKIIELSHILDFKTIAEGIETMDQLKVVKDIGCDIIQGYLGGRPVKKEEVFSVVNKNLYH